MLKLKKLVVPVMVTTMALSALTACGEIGRAHV